RVPYQHRDRPARFRRGRGPPVGRVHAAGHLRVRSHRGHGRDDRSGPLEPRRYVLSLRPRRRSTSFTFASSCPEAPLRSSIFTIVETRSQSSVTALWHRATSLRMSSNSPSTTVPSAFKRYGRPLRSTMSKQPATLVP